MNEELLSALVVMRGTDGRRVPAEAVTAATINEYAPDPAAARGVGEFLADEGFEVSPLVGISFSITAPRSRFESVFGIRLDVSHAGGVTRVAGEEGGLELPLEVLPAELRRHVDAITFTPPPDFGPTDYADGVA